MNYDIERRVDELTKNLSNALPIQFVQFVKAALLLDGTTPYVPSGVEAWQSGVPTINATNGIWTYRLTYLNTSPDFPTSRVVEGTWR